MISMIPNGPWCYGLSLPPRFTWSVNFCQGPAGKVSSGPSGCLLSRTATAGPTAPTSTQVPPLLLL